MNGQTQYRKKNRHRSAKWSKSVAEYLEEQGKLIPNDKLDKRHPKIKNPDKFK